eukprot:gene42647-21733_t
MSTLSRANVAAAVATYGSRAALAAKARLSHGTALLQHGCGSYVLRHTPAAGWLRARAAGGRDGAAAAALLCRALLAGERRAGRGAEAAAASMAQLRALRGAGAAGATRLGPLCDALPHCAALRVLHLSDSPSLLAAEGAAGRLVDALRGCTALTELYLYDCSLDDGAVRGLIPLLSGDGGWGEVCIDIDGNPAVTDELKGELRRRGLVAAADEEKGVPLRTVLPPHIRAPFPGCADESRLGAGAGMFSTVLPMMNWELSAHHLRLGNQLVYDDSAYGLQKRVESKVKERRRLEAHNGGERPAVAPARRAAANSSAPAAELVASGASLVAAGRHEAPPPSIRALAALRGVDRDSSFAVEMTKAGVSVLAHKPWLCDEDMHALELGMKTQLENEFGIHTAHLSDLSCKTARH